MRYLQSVRHVEGVVWGDSWLFEVVIDVLIVDGWRIGDRQDEECLFICMVSTW
jgi:hypothetical protein